MMESLGFRKHREMTAWEARAEDIGGSVDGLPAKVLRVAEIVRRRENVRIRQVNVVSSPHSSGLTGQALSAGIVPDLGVEGSGGVQLQARGQQDLSAEILEEGQADEDIVPVYTPAPQYPDRARELGVEGELEVIFVVDMDGRVTQLEIVKSPHPSFVAETRRVLGSWRFKPARNKGVPVRVRARKVFDFGLE